MERIHRVVIKSPDGPKECPHRLQVLNETLYGNDMTVVRYKLYVDKCKNGIIISLLDKNGVEVRKQQVTETIYDEICSCPTLNFTHRMMCQTNTQIYQQLENDLRYINVPFLVVYDSPKTLKIAISWEISVNHSKVGWRMRRKDLNHFPDPILFVTTKLLIIRLVSYDCTEWKIRASLNRYIEDVMVNTLDFLNSLTTSYHL